MYATPSFIRRLASRRAHRHRAQRHHIRTQRRLTYPHPVVYGLDPPFTLALNLQWTWDNVSAQATLNYERYAEDLEQSGLGSPDPMPEYDAEALAVGWGSGTGWGDGTPSTASGWAPGAWDGSARWGTD
ncbi:hypothetical protein FB451DRAFT_1416702 [Mycena latifolia]|nr:hypothetical protein FB451DRAFT_1416702 [Mycena latifolia]